MATMLDPGTISFLNDICDGSYVDKTGLLGLLNRSLGSPQLKYLCISRPRRFGKTTMADMIAAYYQIGCDSDAIFRPFAISADETYIEHLNRYHVVRLDIARAGSAFSNIRDTISYISEILLTEIRTYANEQGLADKLAPFLKVNVAWYALDSLFREEVIPFVFVIDEWDYLFRRYPDNQEGLTEYLNYLSGLLKGADYLCLAVMTGILPVKTYGDDSILNMFWPVTITNPGEYGEYTGFTEQEAAGVCEKNHLSFEKVRDWYDGYTVPAYTARAHFQGMLSEKLEETLHIYNPNSLVRASLTGRFESYWTNTQSFERLKDYINLDLYGLKGLILNLLDGTRVEINMRKFPYRIKDLPDAESVLTLLVHLGYLTFSQEGEEPGHGFVSIPNREVCEEWRAAVQDDAFLAPLIQRVQESESLLEQTLAGNAEAVAAGIQHVHEENSSIIKANDENSLAAVLSIAYYTAVSKYEIFRELPSGRGFADLAFVPHRGVSLPPMIVEMKWNKSADSAIRQIKDRRYAGKLAHGFGKVLLVGINYEKDTADRNYHVKIEPWEESLP